MPKALYDLRRFGESISKEARAYGQQVSADCLQEACIPLYISLQVGQSPLQAGSWVPMVSMQGKKEGGKKGREKGEKGGGEDGEEEREQEEEREREIKIGSQAKVLSFL